MNKKLIHRAIIAARMALLGLACVSIAVAENKPDELKQRVLAQAQSLGADRLTTFRRVTLPAILPGIVAAALFGFIASFGNLEMSLFLVGPGRTTLPIAILQYLEWKIDPTIAAVSVLQILFIGGGMLLTDRFVKIGRVV